MTDTPKDSQEADVNDVLSSIRELVSQEAKSHAELEARKKAEAEAEEQAAAEAERVMNSEPAEAPAAAPLVLGQAERVEGADEAADEPAEAARPEPLVMDMAALVAPAAAEPEPVPAPTGDAPFFDEATLRTMVGEIVREELQGELGERLNRTIRKIARREVLRAMDEDDDDLGGGLKL